MRTRAVLYIILGILLLAALLAADLVAHGYRALQGVSFEAFRTVLQGVAMSWLVRGVYTLFFRFTGNARGRDTSELVTRPIRLVRRSLWIAIAALVLAFLPMLFRLSLSRQFEPQTFPTVISIDLIGAVWLTSLVLVTVGFWQLSFLRQQTHFARRRFTGWAIAATAYALVHFLIATEVLALDSITTILIMVCLALTGIAAVLLGYRVPWMPHLPSLAKRTLIAFSLANIAIGLALTIVFGGETYVSHLFAAYASFWQSIAVAVFGTTTIYFVFVFFSALFSQSSTELVERKSAEVKSLAKLTRFSSDVLSSELLLDLPRLAEQITTLAREATQSDAAWLELKSSTFAPGSLQKGELTIRSQVGIDETSANAVLSTENAFIAAEGEPFGAIREELTRSRKPVLLTRNRQQHPAELRTSDILHSLVGVPLIRNGEVRGGLFVGKHREDGYDEDDLTVLSAFSDVASLALETARLLADSIEKQKFDGELRAARAMQKSLIPERFPEIEGFALDAFSIPAYDVGGDFYDTTVLLDGSPVITIGDVSGKGISASMYMAETKGVLQGTAPLMPSMPDLLQSANAALLRNLPAQSTMRRSFVTLGMLNINERRITFCRAGHTPLIVVRANGEYEIVQPKGMAVGMMPQTMFNQTLEEYRVALTAGDIMILFSDGITDTRNIEGEDFGYTRLAEAVALRRTETPASISRGVRESLEAFSASERYADDATLVLIKRTS